jgi:hypothetical protein
MSRKDGNPRFLLHVQRAVVHVLDHRTMDNVAFRPTNPVGLNVTFDDDPQLEASTRYGSKPT